MECIDGIWFSIRNIVHGKESECCGCTDKQAEIERLRKTINRMKFTEHLNQASRIVDSWPEWKKNLLYQKPQRGREVTLND